MKKQTPLEFIQSLRPLVNELQKACMTFLPINETSNGVGYSDNIEGPITYNDAFPTITQNHYLSRPGLQLGLSHDKKSMNTIEIHVYDKRAFTICSDRGLSITALYNDADGIGTRIVKISDVPDIYNIEPENWFDLIGHAKEALTRAIICIRTNEPLEPDISWNAVLQYHLKNDASLEFNPSMFKHWVNTWGSLEMKTVLEIAEVIVSPVQDWETWKTLVINGWAALDVRDMSLNSETLLASVEYEQRY